MEKLLNFLDNYILKIAVGFLIAFVPLYPKLPSIYITHTWVYIRLEDFFILLTVIIWLIQLFRKKASLPVKLTFPIGLYWLAGLASLIFSFIVIAPQLNNFFPSVAILSYIRRIEYMLLFFVAFSTIKSKKDIRDYLIILFLALTGVVLYGFGQRLYILFWQLVAPLHLTKYFFCFPSFQTGNEEFAKGIPLCLSANGRVTSTFAGHYDLSAYLVILIPVVIAFIFAVKRRLFKILLFLLGIGSVVVLNFTASRVSFLAYLVSGVAVLILIKKKIFIPAFLILSMVILLLFSQSTARRFLQTFGFASVVIDSQGHVIGEELSGQLGQKYLGNEVDENLPRGTGYLGLPQLKNQKTNTAVIKSKLSNEEAKRLKLENGGVELSTISGNFSVKKVLVYDISFTTRFQAEWPRAIQAFSQNYLLGSGFATITLATDNDYLRLLGETGLLGFIAFISIFLVLGVTGFDMFRSVEDKTTKAFAVGLFAGVLGLFLNAGLIDVFESSKVAETLWLLLGICFGGLFLYKKKEVNYLGYLKRILKSKLFILPVSLFAYLAVFLPTARNFFVADDFIWLKWAATSTVSDISKYFTDASGFFYRPLDKLIFFLIYSFFGFSSLPYHLFILFIHFLSGIVVYLIAKRILDKKYLAGLVSLIFLLLPSQAENLFWISSLSITISSFFVLCGLYSFIKFREKKNYVYLVLSLLLGFSALLSYEGSIVYFALLILVDLFLYKTKLSIKSVSIYLVAAFLDVLYFALKISAHSFLTGGDYSYNLLHFIPNLIGNIAGYLGVFLFGEFFLPIYSKARLELRTESALVFGVIFLGVIALLAVLFLNKKRLHSIYMNENLKKILFFALFMTISLFPFLGLGNIAMRYSYLASFGFAAFVVFILVLISKLVKVKYFLPVAMVLISGFYIFSLFKLSQEWGGAGRITNRTLSYLKLFEEHIPSNSTLYFANVPIKYQNAWAFPVGLQEGIWFIYQDESLKITQTATLEDAKRAIIKNPGKSYIFYFDNNFKMEAYK